MSAPFRVALSGDFRKPDGSPVYPDFDVEPLRQAPNVEFAHLEPRNPVEADQLKDFDALILLAHRFAKGRLRRRPLEAVSRPQIRKTPLLKPQAFTRSAPTDELSRLGEALRLAETVGLPWKASTKAQQSKHIVQDESQRTVFAPEVSLAFRLLLVTGARLREILNLEWRHVDLERGVLLLPDSKTGRRTIVLSTFALELLKHCEQKSEFVFPGTKGVDHERI